LDGPDEPDKKWKSPIGILEGKVKILGDIVNATVFENSAMLTGEEDDLNYS